MDGVQDFFFLMFIPNPTRERVRIFPDGEPTALYLSYDNFKQLMLEVGGYEILAPTNESLMAYGTPWLYIREKNKIIKVNADTDSGVSIVHLVKTAVEGLGEESDDLLNPADKYANADISSYTLKDPFSPSPNSKPGSKISPLLKIR